MWTRSQLKNVARRTYKYNYWTSVLVAFLINMNTTSSSGNYYIQYNQGIEINLNLLRITISSTILSILLAIFIINPLIVSAARYFLNNAEGRGKLENLSFAFRANYKNMVKTMFFVDLFIFLWSLVLIIPGIIKAYEYRMVPYLLAENPDLDVDEAMRLSKKMMHNQKLDTFILDLSFIGWFIVGIATCGIALIFFVLPYREATNVELYKVLRYQVI